MEGESDRRMDICLESLGDFRGVLREGFRGVVTEDFWGDLFFGELLVVWTICTRLLPFCIK